MASGTELRLNAFFRSPSSSHVPTTNVLHLHWQHCRRVSRRTHYGILPPTEDEPVGHARFTQFGFPFELLSEFRHQIWNSVASLNFPLPLCNFLYQNITSFAIDFAAERPTQHCPFFTIIADITFVQNLCVNYTLRPVEFIRPRQLGAAAFAEETFILGGTTEGWDGAEGDSDSLILGIPPDVDEDNNAGIEMLKRIKREKWVMEVGEEINCGVCLEEFSEGDEVMTMECEHTYHGECILTWLKQKHTCPLCRRQI